jgi:putative ABC transport system substrate-binding protein
VVSSFLAAHLWQVAAWPLAARAQQAGKIYRIGFLANDPAIPTQPAGQAFLDGLRGDGFIEGKNIVIERRFAEGRLDRYADLVAELLRLDVDVLVRQPRRRRWLRNGPRRGFPL